MEIVNYRPAQSFISGLEIDRYGTLSFARRRTYVGADSHSQKASGRASAIPGAPRREPQFFFDHPQPVLCIARE